MASTSKATRDVGVTKFSIKTLNKEIDSVLARLKGARNSTGKAVLLHRMKTIQFLARCGEDMSFDL